MGELEPQAGRETQRLKARENGSRGEVCASRGLPGDGKKQKQKNTDETIVRQRVLETGMGGAQGTLQDSPEGLEQVLTGLTNLDFCSQPQPRNPREGISEHRNDALGSRREQGRLGIA